MRTRLVAVAILVAAQGCMHPVSTFDRYLADGRWADAAAALAADSSLLNNEQELYRAALLFGTPARPTYDPARAHDLFTALLTRYPTTEHHDEAMARLNLIDQVARAHADAEAKQRALEAQIATLTAESRALSVQLDSALSQRDSLRASTTRLEADRRDRDDQIKALRLELQRLKEIDLKPRRPPLAVIR